MLHTADIVIVGGGMSGFSAAIAAAKENKKVILVERSARLGGNATNSNVGTICGAYYRTLSQQPKLVGYDFCKDFIADVLSLSATNKVVNYHNGLFIISYDWKSLAEYMEKQLIQAGVHILKNAEIIRVRKEESIISQVTINQHGETIDLNFENIVDCSGNGIISQLAKIEMLSSSSYQAASQIFSVKNIASENEFSLNMILKKTMMQLVASKQLPESFASLSIVPGSLDNNRADFKLTLPDLITDDQEQKMKLHAKAIQYIGELFPLLTNEIDSLKDAEITMIFPEVGIRVQQRSKGKEILQEENVLSCKKTKGGIAIGTWPIEEWDTEGKLTMQYFDTDNGYTIPADCLKSDSISNLYFAGKNISATTKAIASARVIGTCLQTGYAAGKLASCADEAEEKRTIVLLHNELNIENA